MWRVWALAGLVLAGGLVDARAQLDPTRRHLIQLGYNQPTRGSAPIAAYGFYYMNEPEFRGSNYALRLALAPIYLDAELGRRNLVGPHTDVAVGLSGGGFADSYSEIDQGKYEKRESFTGHGGGVSGNVYHLFNPGARVPLHGSLRALINYSDFSRDSDTADTFELPRDFWEGVVRAGLRYGGREPLLFPELAMELSVWYQGHLRSSPGDYGFGGDRELNSASHLFFSRALLIYTLPALKHTLSLNLMLGTSVEADRFSAYRLGGVLPFAGEFPLSIPGYLWQELSADHFALLSVGYAVPLDKAHRWSAVFQGSTAAVDYISGLSQPGNSHSGIGGGIIYRSPSDAWQLMLSYGYGVDAIRDGNRGAHNIGFLLQFDLARGKLPFFDVGLDPNRSRWLDRLLH